MDMFDREFEERKRREHRGSFRGAKPLSDNFPLSERGRWSLLHEGDTGGEDDWGN